MRQRSAAGPQFASVTGAATLPQNTEIAVSAGTGGISLGPNSSIHYSPPDSTSPTTAVTSGTPPSRGFKLNERALF
jgi:hypothetical protein